MLARLPGPLRAAHALCYSSVVVFAPLVALVFWPLLYRGPWFAEPFDAWRNVSQHALNALFALAELLLPRTEPMPWPHLPCLLLVLLAYLALAYLTAAVQGFYPYRFLDRDAVGGRAAVAAYLLGIAAALVLVFCLARALLALRRWLTETRLGCRGRFPPAADLADDAEMHAVAPSKSPSSTGAGPTTTTSILPL
ncbi:hypothetical protein CDD83_3928 [Cordyceps sp. RAO-2017]|nr:hypothetical protein CDD83_3928 [Cordyceps sp. RAO-2017]